MFKNIFSHDEDKVPNNVAGITVVITLFVLPILMKPADIFGYSAITVVALMLGVIAYSIVQFVRKKHSK